MLIVAQFPFSGFMTLATQKGIRFLDWNEEALKAVTTKYPTVLPSVMPANIYPGQDKPVIGYTPPACIVASRDLSAEVVYEFLDTVCEKRYDESWKAFGPTWDLPHKENSAKFIGTFIPLEFVHPGAVKYWKDKGEI